MPLTILHVSQPVDGGVARVVVDLLRGQVADGHRVLLACPVDGPLAAAATAVGALVLPWNAVRSPGPGMAAEVTVLRRLAAENRPDLVHLHSAKAGLAGRLALRGVIPTVFQPHAWSFAAVTGTMALLARNWERRATRWTDRHICVSEAEQAEGVAAGVRGRWAQAPNGVDLEHYNPTRLPLPSQARESLGLSTDPARADGPLAVCVGRLCRQKGQDTLLRAWAGIPAAVPGARLVLVGDGPDRAALEALAAGLPHPDSVVFAGAAADPRDWYAAADLMVLPSRWEGMALVPIEAMASGCPVLLTDVAGAREVLAPGIEPIPVGKPKVLRAALEVTLSDLEGCRAAGVRARARMEARHDVRATVAKVTEVYQEVLRERRVPGPAARTASPAAIASGKSD